MSLIAFHRFLIAAGIVFCFGFAGWEVRAFLAGGEAMSIVLALVFTLLGVVLILYLRHLRRILGYDRDPR
ncbi:MAG: hypothetical protein ACT4O1_02970 [Gemmatimonadota bacterium]